MLIKFVTSVIFLFILLLNSLFAFDKAEGWFESGRKANSYVMGIDKQAGRDGKHCGTIKSIEPNIEGFGILLQKFNADIYRGKKISFSGFMKSMNVSEEASFMIRVDKTDSTAVIDNMHDREIKGNTDWNLYEIIFEVPENAEYISIGASLKGTGQIWFDDLSFEIIHNSTTLKSDINQSPVNLSFETITE